MSFISDINKWVEKAKTDRDTVVTEVFQNIGTAIVSRTPVGDVSLWTSLKTTSDAGPIQPVAPDGYRPGTLANNWFAGFGEPGEPTLRPHNVNGSQSLANISNIAKEFPGKVAYIVNPAPYANRIEYGGHSSQRPNGMVRVTVADFQQIVKVAVNGVE